MVKMHKILVATLFNASSLFRNEATKSLKVHRFVIVEVVSIIIFQPFVDGSITTAMFSISVHLAKYPGFAIKILR